MICTIEEFFSENLEIKESGVELQRDFVPIINLFKLGQNTFSFSHENMDRLLQMIISVLSRM